MYCVYNLLGEGAYAKVFKAELSDEDDFSADAKEVVLKVQKPACPWEFYITSELHRRLQQLNHAQSVVSFIFQCFNF